MFDLVIKGKKEKKAISTYVWEKSFDSYSVNNSSALQKTQLEYKFYKKISKQRCLLSKGVSSKEIYKINSNQINLSFNENSTNK